MKKDVSNSRSKVALALLAALGLAHKANAQDGTELVEASALEGVVEVRQLSDGSIELVLEDGNTVVVEASDVAIDNGRVMITAEAVTSLADAGAFAFLEGNAALIGAGVAATALAVGLGVGLSGDGDDDDGEVVIGTDGDDLLTGTVGDDTIDGGAGADTIDGGAGNDNITGGLGNDTLVGGAGNDTVDGGAGDDSVTGGLGDDTLIGGDGNDFLTSDAGVDTFLGGAGDDTIALGEAALPGEVINGGEGIDTLDLSALSEGVAVDLDLNTPQPGPASQDGAILDAQGGDVVADVIDVENVIGTSGNDSLFGNNEVNVLDGGAGDDVFHSFGGADFVNGGEGTDTVLFSAGGAVEIDLDENGDAVASVGDTVTSIENITGSAAGDDTIAGNSGANVLNGNGGNDTLTGELGDDTLIGGEGFDTADFSDLDVPITVQIDANGNGTVVRETGFEVSFENVAIDPDNLLENATLNPALSGDLITEALAGNLYFNIHTNDFNGGEIRGQLDTIVSNETVDGVQTIVLSASLDAAQEPGGTSDSTATGTGTVTFVVAADGSITYSAELNVTGLATSDLLPVAGFSQIHLHNAPAGDDPAVNNGPVVLDIVQDAGGDINGAALSPVADTGDGDVFAEVTETDTLESIENVIGSDDIDTVDLSGETEAVFVDLDVNSPPGANASQEGGLLDAAPNAGGSVVIGLNDFENVIGGSGDDVIFGNQEVNVLTGGAGNDVFHSFGGADFVNGGEGTDTVLFSAGGAVTVDLDDDGNAVASVGDTITSIENITGSNAGDDSISGNAGVNILNGNGGSDSLFGEGGDDVLISDGVDTLLDGGEGVDTVNFSNITDSGINIDLDTNTPQPGPATQIGAAELFDGDNAIDNNPVQVVDVENVIGTNQNDRIFGNNEINVLDGLGGDDVFHSFGGADFVNGGEGTDTVLFSAGGAVTIDLDDNGDAVASVGDTVTSIENITGSASGDDTISGNAGANVLNGNGGSDSLFGEGGDDTLVSDGIDTILDGGEGVDTVDFSGVTGSGINIDLDTNTPQPGPATQTGAAELFDGDNAIDNNPFDVIDIENVIGTDQNDRIFGNNEVNVLDGGGGDDTFHSFGGADFVNGGEGTDTVLFSAGGAVTIDLDDNGDAVASVGDTVTSIENITGSAAGDDTISGNASVNVLNGNGGNDTLNGEGGDDTLIGGVGSDTFVETEGSGADTVTDFAIADDVIDVAGHGLTAAEALALAVDNAGDALIDFGGGDTLTLTGVAAGDLTEANFVGAAPAASAAPEPLDLSDFPESFVSEQLINGPGEATVSVQTASAFDIDQVPEDLDLGLESPPAPLSGSDLGDSL